MNIVITKHFARRFRKRVAHTSRVAFFAERAYRYGRRVEDINHRDLLFKLAHNESLYNATAYIYNNFVYWFDQNTAVTVYALPQCFRGRI